jgi:hypothetical protein
MDPPGRPSVAEPGRPVPRIGCHPSGIAIDVMRVRHGRVSHEGQNRWGRQLGEVIHPGCAFLALPFHEREASLEPSTLRIGERIGPSNIHSRRKGRRRQGAQCDAANEYGQAEHSDCAHPPTVGACRSLSGVARHGGEDSMTLLRLESVAIMRAAVAGGNASSGWMGSPRMIIIAGGVFVAALLFRLLTLSLTNDDYLHLSLAQQVLLGDVPVRDFIDPGEFLFYYLSAAVQFLFGRHLLSEVILDVLLLAAGYTLIFLLASHASRSRAVGVFVTTIAVLLLPRLYSYPKVFLYAVAVSLMWRYIERRGTRELAILALWTAVAFLFRHDHGTNIAAASGVMLAVTHWYQGWRAAAWKVLHFGGVTALLLLPFFIFLQVNGGVISYVRNMLATGRGEYERTVGPYPRLLVPPRITVRWEADVDEPGRRALEERFHLSTPEDRGGGAWRYDLADASTRNVAALVGEPAVADTVGLDRSRLTVTAHVIELNFSVWSYYLTLILPPLAIVSLLRTRRDTSPPTMEHEREKIASTAVLAALMHLFLLRTATQSAIADVSAVTAVLGAWQLRRGLMPWPGVAPWPLARAVLTLAVLAGTLAAIRRTDGADALQNLVETLENNGIGPIMQRLNGLRQGSPFADAGARYVFDCTEEDDRLLVTGYAPHLHYKSGRGFAAGRPYFLPSFAPLPASERFSLERLMQQRVPIVLAESDRTFGSWPSIDDYVRRYYRRAATIEFEGTMYEALVDVRIPPACRYGSERLPCFRSCSDSMP